MVRTEIFERKAYLQLKNRIEERGSKGLVRYPIKKCIKRKNKPKIYSYNAHGPKLLHKVRRGPVMGDVSSRPAHHSDIQADVFQSPSFKA